MRDARSKGLSYSTGTHQYRDPERSVMASLAKAQLSFRKAMCDSFDTQTGINALLEVISKANVYERGTSRKDLNVAVLEEVARWTGEMLRMLGLGEGVKRDGDVGWGEKVKEGEGDSIDVSIT